MSQPGQSEFERCAIASGLLTREQLDEALSAMVQAEPVLPAEDGNSRDRRLANVLVRFGYLNAWQAKQLLEGRTRFTLGPYRIVDWLGQGGMGHVFRAEHHVQRQPVAIKVLPRERSTPEAIESFTREIRAQAALNHENLVRALDAGHDGNVYYLVTEFVPGTDLRRLVRARGPLGMRVAASLISQVARGLDHAHQRGLIHRDVKPGNVLVTPDGHAKLSDLGLAGPLEGDARSDPRFGKIVGTADYFSPDHIKAPWAPTPAWDIYSLGCTLYYALTSKVPFPGGSTAQKAKAHCKRRPLDPRRFNPRLSAEFVDVLADMMAKDPAERISSAAEVVARLAPWSGPPTPLLSLDQGGSPVAIPMSIPSVTPLRHDLPAVRLADTEDVFPELEEKVDRRGDRSRFVEPTQEAGRDDRWELQVDTQEAPSGQSRLLDPLVIVLVPLGLVLAAVAAVWLARMLW